MTAAEHKRLVYMADALLLGDGHLAAEKLLPGLLEPDESLDFHRYLDRLYRAINQGRISEEAQAILQEIHYSDTEENHGHQT